MKTYLRIINFAKPFSSFLPQFVSTSFLSIIFGLINISLFFPLLNVIFEKVDPETLAKYAEKPEFSISGDYIISLFNHYMYISSELNGRFGTLIYVCIMVTTSVFLSNLFRYFSTITLSRVRVRVIKNLRERIFINISKLHVGYFTEQRKGDIISRIINDVQMVESSITNSLKVFFLDPPTVIAYFAFLIFLSPELTLFTFLILPLSGILITELAKRLKKSGMENQQSIGRINNILDETLGGMRVIKAFNAEKYIDKVFGSEIRKYARLNFSFEKKNQLASPMSEFLGVVAVSGILIYGGNLVINEGTMAPSAFLTYLGAFAMVLTPAKNISRSVTAMQRGIAAADRVFDLVDTPSEITNKEDALHLEAFKEDIRFENVSFAYAKEKVLKDINFTIKKGKMVALVGPSGGGKSTIADLIPRFYDPIEGEIKIDNISLRDYDYHSIRQHMGIVTQESILFNDTIFNNIAFGVDHATEEAVTRAASIANAHDFIMQTEHGYQSVIGERGSKLSGGQRQRISIARAVLKNPDILILDEATSALDSESEKLVQEALSNLMKNRTSLVIAHRLSTIQNADEILVIRDGEIVERGDHNSLIEKGGLYHKLISMQAV